jgi:DNA-binding NtrC family response regulator
MKRTLIVTTNSDIADLIKIFVSNRLGGNQTCSQNPSQAISLLESQDFDLIVCDFDLLSLDCKQLFMKIQQRLKKIPTILMIDSVHGSSSINRDHFMIVERFDFKKLSEVIEILMCHQVVEKEPE